MKYCKYCGNSIDSNSVFCDKCGGDLRIGAGTDNDVTENTTTNFAKSATSSNVRTGGDWCKLMYTAFAIWGLSFILLFLDWFTINIYGDYSISFNLFSMTSALKRIDYDIDLLVAFTVIFTALTIVFAIIALYQFLKRRYKMFSTGITLSVIFFVFALVPIATMEILIEYAGDEEEAVGIIIGSILKTTAVPYIIIIANIAAFVIMLFAKRGYIDEFGAPDKVKAKIMTAFLNDDDLLCSECGKYSKSTSEYCIFCGSEKLISPKINSEPLKSENRPVGNERENERSISQESNSKLLESGNYLICAECESINPPDSRECFYCGAELYVPEDI